MSAQLRWIESSTGITKDLESVTTRLKNTGVISEICNAIQRELIELGMIGKSQGIEKLVRSVPYARYLIDDAWLCSPLAGPYICRRLGAEALNLGFLEYPVVEEFKTRFEKTKLNYWDNSDSEFAMERYWAYETRMGLFVICHTEDGWRIKRRIA